MSCEPVGIRGTCHQNPYGEPPSARQLERFSHFDDRDRDRIDDPKRFTEAGFARLDGSAPLAASTAEGPGEPVRHRFNSGGNRRVNAIVHRVAVTQLRCEPRAQTLYANARGHTKREARGILKRHLSNVI